MSVRIIVEAKWVQQLKLENAFSWLNYNLYALYILWDKPCKVEFTINMGFNHWRCFKDKSYFGPFILHNIHHQILAFWNAIYRLRYYKCSMMVMNHFKMNVLDTVVAFLLAAFGSHRILKLLLWLLFPSCNSCIRPFVSAGTLELMMACPFILLESYHEFISDVNYTWGVILYNITFG